MLRGCGAQAYPHFTEMCQVGFGPYYSFQAEGSSSSSVQSGLTEGEGRTCELLAKKEGIGACGRCVPQSWGTLSFKCIRVLVSQPMSPAGQLLVPEGEREAQRWTGLA